LKTKKQTHILLTTTDTNAAGNEPVPGNEHFIVCIGASAGGLEAIHEFFDNMPSNGNLSFVIIQHLSPDYKSLLVELVSKHTNMKVREAQHNTEVEPNAVYVIPNDKLLTISGGHLQLRDKNFEKAPNTAIDTFLHSLAEDQGARSIAIILSGTGTDGSRGIQTIQKKGGMVLIQDPVSARFDGMPNSAIATGHADYILSPELMPEEIFNYIKERPVRFPADGQPDEAQLPDVLKLIDKHCHYDFYNYKTPTILRRIGRRMNQLGYNNFKQYIEFLYQSGEECRILGKEFLIGVTKFFRDKAAFDLLRYEVIPEMIRAKQDREVLKIWVTACSTGEEAYSIAMLVDDLLQDMGRDMEVKIFATDIDVDALEHASKGIYPSISLSEMEEHLVDRYFTRQGNQAIVHPKLRKQIVFARHNILKDPPFIKNDLVTCRNMLIYMNAILQRKVFSTLQFALSKGGVLFLGPSEVPASIRDGFQEISSKWKIYRKISSETGYAPERLTSTQLTRPNQREHQVPPETGSHAKDLAEDFKSLLTEEYGFAAVYVDKDFEIKEAVGDFKKYLTLPDRITNLQLLKMVGPELSIALNTAIRKSVKEKRKVALNHIRVHHGEATQSINIFVKPARRDGWLMIVFSESHDHNFSRPSQDFLPVNAPESVSYINELEDELKETRASLHMAVESLETANEELQSSNEELLSANEELQSSNEELQSLNEELHTLNTEHQLRIKELVELNDDLNNYFRSTEIAQVFVDSKLRIRKYNPVAVDMINLIETDIGRPIDHISTNIKDNNILRDIKTVIDTAKVVEKEVMLSSNRISLMRILPYERKDKKVDGVVISFVDITKVKELDNIIKGTFNASLSAVMAFRSVLDAAGKVVDFEWIAANYAADRLMRRPTSSYIGKSMKVEYPELVKKGLFHKCVSVQQTGEPIHTELSLQQEGGEEWFEVIATQMMNGLVITLTNINEKKKSEENLRKNYHELVQVKEHLRNLNAALEEKVRDRTHELSQSEERFRLVANATNDVIWDWDLVNNQLWWSESFYSLFGYSHEEVVTKITFWMDKIHPADRDEVNASIHDAINNNSNWSGRYRFRKADGTYAMIFDRGSVLTDSNGTPYRMIGSMMDVTEAEASEQKLKEKNDELESLIQEFQFVTDFMPQMVWSTKPDGFHDFYNKGWFDYTGLTYEQSVSEGWSTVLHPDDAERTWKIWQECLQTGINYEVEYRMKRYDGEYRWFLARAIPLKDEKGRILKWFGTCTDVHDQKMASDILEQKINERTAELQRANIDLEASNNELLQFASVASHDLKEPLRKIHMFSNLIKDRFLADTGSGALDYMDRIISASARMTRLINDLLTFTRLSVSSTPEKADLNTIVAEVLSDLELMIQEKNALIETTELPQVDIVTGQIRQVFQNIISNALKFSKKDERPHIRISSVIIGECRLDAPQQLGGGYCRITISDNGIGFDNAYAEKIFTIFQRLHSREKYDGTGIGLAITRKIIEKHKGLISATSKEGEGSTFTIVLPLKQEAEEV
jgi:two-component system CheB/CheR fusion protein